MTGPPAAEATSGDALEALARAAYLDLEFPQTIRHWEAAYAAHREAGTPVGAVRVARMLGCLGMAPADTGATPEEAMAWVSTGAILGIASRAYLTVIVARIASRRKNPQTTS